MKREVTSDNLTVGRRGEAIAVAYLKGQRFVIMVQNFRCKAGEIDIVARDGKTLVFVEVKTRRNDAYGPPELAVTAVKQRQISKAALTYIVREKLEGFDARFDVLAILLLDHAVPRIEHIRDAFELAY